MDKEKIEKLFAVILCEIEGIKDPSELRVGLKETPKRVADMYDEIFEGYSNDADKYIKIFKEKYNEVIISKDIEFYSLCEHHLVPFYGSVDIAYLQYSYII